MGVRMIESSIRHSSSKMPQDSVAQRNLCVVLGRSRCGRHG